jgi:hypothetical protein
VAKQFFLDVGAKVEEKNGFATDVRGLYGSTRIKQLRELQLQRLLLIRQQILPQQHRSAQIHVLEFVPSLRGLNVNQDTDTPLECAVHR